MMQDLQNSEKAAEKRREEQDRAYDLINQIIKKTQKLNIDYENYQNGMTKVMEACVPSIANAYQKEKNREFMRARARARVF